MTRPSAAEVLLLLKVLVALDFAAGVALIKNGERLGAAAAGRSTAGRPVPGAVIVRMAPIIIPARTKDQGEDNDRDDQAAKPMKWRPERPKEQCVQYGGLPDPDMGTRRANV